MFIEKNQLNFDYTCDYTKRIQDPVNRLNWILIDATCNSATERRYDPAQRLPWQSF